MISTVQKTPDGRWNEMEFANPVALNPRHELVQQERAQMVRAALKELKAICLDSIALFYYQQLTYQEISEKLGISKKTVGSRLFKCLEKLHAELRKLPQFERKKP